MERLFGSNNRLIVCKDNPAIEQLVYQIRQEKTGGQPLRKRLFAIAQMLVNVRDGQQQPIVEDNSVIIGIPRGGVPMYEGVKSIHSQSPSYLMNAGAKRDSLRQLLPVDFPRDQSFEEALINDAVIITGKTIDETVQSILAKSRVNRISVFTVIALKEGVDLLLSRYPSLTIFAGDIEIKAIQRWDPYRFKLIKTINIGNIGQLVDRN